MERRKIEYVVSQENTKQSVGEGAMIVGRAAEYNFSVMFRVIAKKSIEAWKETGK